MKAPPAWLALLADLRAGRGIDALAAAWAGGNPGAARWYAESLRAYLGGLSSQDTAQKAQGTLAFFFAWVSEARARREGTTPRLLSPDEVLESDVKAWVTWLREGGSWVVPAFADGPLAQAVVQVLEDHGRGASSLDWTRVHALVKAQGVAMPRDAGEFTALLGDLTRRKFIGRTPKLTDVRILGDDGNKRRLRPGETPPPDAFSYFAVKAKGEAAPATLAARLSTVSALFRELLRPKNIRGVACPVSVNPASFALEKASRAKMSEERPRAVARKSTPADLALLRALIAEAPGRTDVIRCRDSLLVDLLYTMGLRLSEATGARLGDLHEAAAEGGTRLALRVHRKGGKAQVLPVSDAVRSSLEAYHQALRSSAREPSFVDVALSPGAPLLQGICAWGKASELVAERVARARAGAARGPKAQRQVHPALVPMTTQGVERVFHRYIDVAVQAIAEGPAREAAHAQLALRLHPHGLRHLFAQVSLEGGMGLREVAAQMGHDGIGTLERHYAPEVDTMRFDYRPLLEQALGGPVPWAPPRAAESSRKPAPRAASPSSHATAPPEGPAAELPQRPRQVPSEGAALVEARPGRVRGDALPATSGRAPETIHALGEQGRASVFLPSPAWAYQTAPLLLDDRQVKDLLDRDVPPPREAVSAYGLPSALREEALLFSGLLSLLPYRVLEVAPGEGSLRVNGAPQGRLFVPVPCLTRSEGDVGELVRLGETTLDPARGEARRALARWWAYLLSAGRMLQLRLSGNPSWLPFAAEEPEWNGPTESLGAWRARMHRRYLRAHDVQQGIGGFLETHGRHWPDALDAPQVRAFEAASGTLRPNPDELYGVALAELSIGRIEASKVGAMMAQEQGPVAREMVRLFVGLRSGSCMV